AALADFHNQPWVQALRHHDAHPGSAPRFASLGTANMYATAVDAYQAGRDVYTTYQARMAVLGHAVLTADGQWLTPGHHTSTASTRSPCGSASPATPEHPRSPTRPPGL